MSLSFLPIFSFIFFFAFFSLFHWTFIRDIIGEDVLFFNNIHISWIISFSHFAESFFFQAFIYMVSLLLFREFSLTSTPPSFDYFHYSSCPSRTRDMQRADARAHRLMPLMRSLRRSRGFCHYFLYPRYFHFFFFFFIFIIETFSLLSFIFIFLSSSIY